MTETDPEKRLIGYACISTYGQMLDTQLSCAHLRRRRRSGIGRLTDPTAAAQLWLRAGSSCPIADMAKATRKARMRPPVYAAAFIRRIGQLPQLRLQQSKSTDLLHKELGSAVFLGARPTLVVAERRLGGADPHRLPAAPRLQAERS